MSVRLLAGPFPLVTTEGDPLSYVEGWTWFPHVGLLCHAGFPVTSNASLGLITLDGKVALIGRFYSNWSWWPEKERLLNLSFYQETDDNGVTTSGYRETTLEPMALLEQGTNPADWMTFSEGSGIITRYLRLTTRRIYGKNGQIWRQTNGLNNAPESAGFPFAIYEVAPGRSYLDAWVLSSPNGRDPGKSGCFYDTGLLKIASPVYTIDTSVPGFSYLGYASDYGVLFSIHYDSAGVGNIRVWSLEVHPTILTAPIVFDGEVKSGQVVTYQVQLLGDQNEGAEGELVNWMLTGAGTLLDIQTKTDANGFATARVQYKLGETGDSTVTASVLC